MQERPPHHTDTGFQNYPFIETAAPKGTMFYLRRLWQSIFVPGVPEGHVLSKDEAMKQLNAFDDNRMTWLGHATFLIKTAGVTIITDPFLSEFASPFTWVGPRRIADSGITTDDLSEVDIIVITHSHYDHLDEITVEGFKHKDRIQVLVPLGLKSFFTNRGYTNVTEMDWHDSVEVENIRFTALPAVHDSARSMSDRNKTLWASWAMESDDYKILFVGDSGYSDVIYKAIGKQFGVFDYAILPIGAYEPRDIMWMSHVTPEESVVVGQEVNARRIVASHWGTVSSLTDEPLFEPSGRFVNAGMAKGFAEKDLWVMKVGETRPLLAEEVVQ